MGILVWSLVVLLYCEEGFCIHEGWVWGLITMYFVFFYVLDSLCLYHLLVFDSIAWELYDISLV